MPIASIFSVAPPYVSSNVVPELQKRGLYHKEYAGKIPLRKCWRASAASPRLE